MKRIEIECPYCGKTHVHNIEGVQDIPSTIVVTPMGTVHDVDEETGEKKSGSEE